MDFKIGDLVTRNSHNNDIIFTIIKIDGDMCELKGKGDIIFYLDGLEVVSLATLKNTDEKKICTLLVNEDYRKKGYSKQILEDSFEYLQTDTPLITIPTKRLDEFNKIIDAYNWKETSRTDEYYSEEVIFNSPKTKTL